MALRPLNTKILSPTCKNTLKRNLNQHNSLRKDPFDVALSLQFSAHSSRRSSFLPIDSINKNCVKTLFPEFSQDGLSNLDTSTEESTSVNVGNIQRFQQKIDTSMDQDLKLSIRNKEKKNYYHRYEQKEDTTAIWISQPKWIPKQVSAYYEKCANGLGAGESVNFLQGFLSELGFMYYFVENTLFCYDIETMNQESRCRNIIQIQKKIVNAFYGIQVLQIGPPYTTKKRKTLVFLHIYQIQLYHFTIVRDLNSERGRILQIKSLNINFQVSSMKPRIIVSGQGTLYYSNDQGRLDLIQLDSSTISSKVSFAIISSQRARQQIRIFWSKLAKNMTHNIKSFVRSIVNFSKSVFRSKSLQTSLFYDPQKKLFMLYRKTTMRNNVCNQQIRVYQEQDMGLLYTIFQDEILDKHSLKDTVVNLQVLEHRLNKDYNFMILLDSGKRVFMDIGVEGVAKSVIYQSPPNLGKHFSEYSQSSHTIEPEGGVLRDTYCALLMSEGSTLSCSLLRDQIYSTYQVVYRLDVQIHGGGQRNEYYLFNRQLQALGPLKEQLLSQCSGVGPGDMNIQVQQVFYRPQEIVHSSDKMAQRVVLLRPVDIFFSIANQFQNLPLMFKALETAFPSVKSEQFVSLSCQVLLDEEGVYFISGQVIINVKVKLGFRLDQHQKRGATNCRQIGFKNIKKQVRTKIQDFIIDISSENVHSLKEERQLLVATGFIKYIGKLLRVVWSSNINDLDREACRASILIVQSWKKLILRTKKMMRCGDGGILSLGYKWGQRLRQLLILIRSVLKLPNKKLSQSILMDPSQFHECLFDFLNNYCKPQICDSLRNAIPYYVSDEFVRLYKSWLSMRQMRTIQQKIKCCRGMQYLPDFFINFIAKERGLSHLQVLSKKQSTSIEGIKQYFSNISSYKQILKDLKEKEGSFIEKEILLKKAEEKLREQARFNEQLLREGLAEIEELMTLMKIQKQIKQFYEDNKKETKSWGRKLSQSLKMDKESDSVQEEEIGVILQRYIFDYQILGELIADTEDPVLDIVFANYYLSDQVVTKIGSLIQNTLGSCRTIKQVTSVLSKQLKYFLQNVKISVSPEIMAKIYIQKISEQKELMEIMRSEEGVLDGSLFFPLTMCAQITSQIQRLKKWAIRALRITDRNTPYFLYLCACTVYLIRDVSQSKCEQLQQIFMRGGLNEPILKKLSVLLSEEKQG